MLLVAISWIAIWRINKHFRLFWNSNTITVSCYKPLSCDRVKIGWADERMMHNISSKTSPTKSISNYLLIFDKKVVGPIGNEYGPNDFFITYGDSLCCEVHHLKLNRHNQHDYKFEFYYIGGRVLVKGSIEGEYEMKFDEVLNPIGHNNKALE